MGTEQTTTIKVKCDYKGCSTTIIWIQQEVQTNPDSLPDAAWRLLSFGTFDGKVYGFCSKTCLLNFLRDFVPLKSPREQAAIAATEKQAAEMESEGGSGVIGIPAPSNPTTKDGSEPDATGNDTEVG